MRLTRKWPDFKRSRLKQGESMFIGHFSVHVDPQLYSCALDYAGTEADYDGVPLDVEVEPAKDSI